MAESERRTVGQRGQVTIPKRLRERLGIRGGDEVVVSERDGRLVIEKAVSRADLAVGYRERAERDRRIAAEMDGTSEEADDLLGDTPEW